MKYGIFLGRFAPWHKGHQYVLDQITNDGLEPIILVGSANPDTPIMSFVADSYDVYNFTNFCTHPDSRIRKLIESRPHQKLILRPDSGNPIEVLREMTKVMYHKNKVQYTLDSNDRCLFLDFGFLWGDGITLTTIKKILDDVIHRGYAAENFVFGSGGDLMQNHTRDTQKFAIKCSSITLQSDTDCTSEELHTFERDVYKDPITDPGKKSKRGRVTTYYDPVTEAYFTDVIDSQAAKDRGAYEVLQTIYENGNLIRIYELDEIRQKIKS